MLDYTGKVQILSMKMHMTAQSAVYRAWLTVHDDHGMHVDYTIIVHHWTTSNL